MPKRKADEHASRINYLFQAAEHVARVSPALNEHYGKVLTVISEKTTAKKDFTMKRSMCKKCRAVLVPGVNIRYRLRKRKHKKAHPTMVITCLNCSEVKRLQTKPGFKLNCEGTCQIDESPLGLAKSGDESPSASSANADATTSQHEVGFKTSPIITTDEKLLATLS